MKLTGLGGLQIQARKASGAYPVPNTTVRIIGAEELNRNIVYSVITDNDGNTPIINLPTVDKSFSLKSGALEAPYSIYDAEISADGYYPKRIRNIAVFSDTIAVQPINMIALSETAPLENYPLGNLDATVFENPNLE